MHRANEGEREGYIIESKRKRGQERTSERGIHTNLMTSEVILHIMKNLRLYDVSIHIILYQNRCYK